jgi:hypothetical protein
MKGFIKILESIIASILLLTSLTFFFTATPKQSGWDDALLQIRAEDAMYALEKNGSIEEAVQAGNGSRLQSIITAGGLSIFPPTVDYSISIDGTPNPVIYVGCLCNEAQKADLTAMLSPLDFEYKKRNMSIRIDNFTVGAIRDETNILFTFNPDLFKYDPINSSILDNFLRKGGTLFMLSDLIQAQAQDSYIAKTFNLTWAAADPSNGVFDEPNNASRITFKIANYFDNLSGLGRGQIFYFSSANSYIASDYNTVVLSSGTARKNSQIKVNDGAIYGNGRTVWFANYDRSTSGPTTQLMNNLTKSVVMWASGENFKIVPPSLKTLPPQRNIKSRLLISGIDSANGMDNGMYEAVLTMWHVFQ